MTVNFIENMAQRRRVYNLRTLPLPEPIRIKDDGPKVRKRYVFKKDELDEIYANLRGYAIILKSGSTPKRNEYLRSWAHSQNYHGPLDVDSLRDFVEQHLQEIDEEQDWFKIVEYPTAPIRNGELILTDEEVEEIVNSAIQGDYEGPHAEVVDEDDLETDTSQETMLRWFKDMIAPRYLKYNVRIKLVLQDSVQGTVTKVFCVNSAKALNEVLASINRGIYIIDPVAHDSSYYITEFPQLGYIVAYGVEVFDGGITKLSWNRRRGHFFKYLATVTNPIILEALRRCQIFDKPDPINEPCLIYSLRQAGVQESVLTTILETRMLTDDYPITKCEKLFNEFNLAGKIACYRNDGNTRIVVNTGDDFKIYLYEGHFFLSFDTGMTSSWVKEAVKNPSTKIPPNRRWDGSKWKADSGKRTIKSEDLACKGIPALSWVKQQCHEVD